MRGRSTKQNIKEIMETDKLCKLKEEPQLSGAYIRSLVKQLTSSRSKSSMHPKDPECVDGDGVPGQNLTQVREGINETSQPQQPQQPQQHKKQVRRRLHTSKPYQERLLNMAEARREIVTALKYHRASMKQANEKQQQQQQQNSQPVQLSPSPFSDQEGKIKSSIYPSETPNFSSYLDNFSYSAFSHPPPPNFSWPVCSIPPPPVAENLNLALPNQPLGLNLNFHDFHNLDTNLYHNTNNFSVYSPSSPSSSSSPPISYATKEVPSVAISHNLGPAPVSESYGGGHLHPVMDEEEMAELRSIGEQYQMEWNDRMNLVTSAWWFKFLTSMELEPEKVKPEEDDGYHPFDEIMEFPAWSNANESCLHQHFDDGCSPEYFQDPALPCMDIEEIDGMDGDWLA
ncbi:Hydroxyproline-rich glycoprotein family protein [Tripterygium wilfordii]|uniref:Hydroxyproline-rich glycoprotein family protein n=1 Tax=Tripterygium wilfordii TaxID=458696 RepID=A0A7J7BWS6_TRIWF|nr:uncharacterized protein LOC119992553 [Tripterygium wilfordii]KAF5726125.1 Hydroxyproline-rich glycoprotein family protein [Tripterygium wilfordii]